MDLDALVTPLRADTGSGAATLARRAADVMATVAKRFPAKGANDLRATLERLALRVLQAQPAMAPLVTLAREVLEAVLEEGDLEAVRARATGAALAFGDALEGRLRAVAAQASERLPEGGVFTLSSSSTVLATLLLAARARPLRVTCLESRPGNEGRALAEALSREGVEVTYAVDAALSRLLPGCGSVLLGADSVGDLGMVGKIGARAAVETAGRHGIPVLVAADSTKLLPLGFPQPVDDDRPASEVWAAPPGVRVWNRYFEVVPGALVSALVTEDAVLDAAALDRKRATLSVPAALLGWAAGR